MVSYLTREEVPITTGTAKEEKKRTGLLPREIPVGIPRRIVKIRAPMWTKDENGANQEENRETVRIPMRNMTGNAGRVREERGNPVDDTVVVKRILIPRMPNLKARSMIRIRSTPARNQRLIVRVRKAIARARRRGGGGRGRKGGGGEKRRRESGRGGEKRRRRRGGEKRGRKRNEGRKRRRRRRRSEERRGQ